MTGKEHKTPARPLPSSSVMLIRDYDGQLQVLMHERPKTMKFAPGALVFPGGKVDFDDGRNFWVGRHNGSVHQRDDITFRIAALRELQEETGVWHLTTKAPVNQRKTGSFRRIVKRYGWKLDVKSMYHFAHWVTPEPLPMRFDTHFYLCPLKGHQRAFHDGTEVMKLQWVNPVSVLHDWENDNRNLMFPTRLNLLKLSQASSVAEAVAIAKSQPVVRTLPTIAKHPEGPSISIGKESGFAATHASAREIGFESSKKPGDS